MLRPILLAAALSGACAAAAQAHVGVTPREAQAGGYQLFRFGVGHACAGAAATRALRLEIPAGVVSARPQPKPGWTLSMEPGAAPGAAPRAIVWTGGLPGDRYEEFLVFMKLPAAADAMTIPAIQTCDKGEVRWTGPAGSAEPAPSVRLLGGSAPAPMEGMDHDHH